MYKAQIFLTSALVGDEWSAIRPSCFTLGEKGPGIYCVGGWVGPETGVDNFKNGKLNRLIFSFILMSTLGPIIALHFDAVFNFPECLL
jgi:hypothetical protein